MKKKKLCSNCPHIILGSIYEFVLLFSQMCFNVQVLAMAKLATMNVFEILLSFKYCFIAYIIFFNPSSYYFLDFTEEKVKLTEII